jgi:2-polyprenyl-3-methyl-5-hydroxy-6-metoxy-1,4-benzoquinol methylase
MITIDPDRRDRRRHESVPRQPGTSSPGQGLRPASTRASAKHVRSVRNVSRPLAPTPANQYNAKKFRCGLPMMRIFGDSTDEVWNAFGRDDPYFGVLSQKEYSRENLNPASLEGFFRSGEAKIAEVMSLIEQSGIALRMRRALDFGCGVGRLVIPLANRFTEVVGIDVSEGMLAECRKNIAHRQLQNVVLSRGIPNLEFDLVHSALVFQHINSARGSNIILDCWSRIAPGGLLAVQLPIRFTGNRTTWYLRQLRNAVPILQIPYNLLSGSRWNRPGVQMNIYDLSFLSAKLLERGAKQIVLMRQDSDLSFVGVYLLAVKK